ncbi:hypothetical protein [Nocardioides sp. GXQ0305]|uniref:hypothetical protein n=1 Tax=Nocardioides sp. GXQ0305 TaxID=3423912 RepID=UPI003D7C4373
MASNGIRHKISTLGWSVKVEPMPPAHVLEAASDETREAVEALRVANAASREAERATIAARKERRLEEVPSKIPALEDKVHAAEQEERARLKEAQGAARGLARLLDAEADDLASKAARLKVEQHVRACDAYADLVEVVGHGRSWSLDRPSHALARFADPRTQAKPNVGEFGRFLDETNVEDVLERAGMTAEEAGLVRVYRRSSPAVRFLTTPARARVLGSDYLRADEEGDK